MTETLAQRFRPTIRVRLTLLYGGLFFAAGVVLLGVTYVLLTQSLESQPSLSKRMITIGGERAGAMGEQALPGPANEPPNAAFVAQVSRQADEAVKDYRQATLNSLLTQGGISLALVGAVAVGLGWLMADRALRPVHRVTETARRVAHSNNLTERIRYEGPRDDIKDLADTFDTMLSRLARAFEGQRRFVANASHELRTPLAINRTLVDVAVRRPDATDDLRRLGESLLVVNARHERLIDGLLTLAGSENAVGDVSPVDLSDVAGHVLDQAREEAGQRGLEVHQSLAPAPTQGDPVLLERLVQNLVENAVRHNTLGGGEVRLATRRYQGCVELQVTNTGPVVPPYDLETIFEPFRRLRGDRVSSDRGSGLGLSIVRAIATAHGGLAHAASREGGGLIVTVRLPG